MGEGRGWREKGREEGRREGGGKDHIYMMESEVFIYVKLSC